MLQTGQINWSVKAKVTKAKETANEKLHKMIEIMELTTFTSIRKQRNKINVSGGYQRYICKKKTQSYIYKAVRPGRFFIDREEKFKKT